jgi:penicillin-binding protein 1A
MWRALAGGLIALLALFIGINYIAIPSFRELEDPNSALASDVLGNNKEVLGRYFIENRVPVTYEELSPNLVNALISSEDERFRDHCGIDSRAVLRVMVRTILMQNQSAGGGSTLTQQLAKNLYSDRNFKGMSKIQKTFALIYRKLREWITAVKLEKAYTKEEIIAMYLNQFNFINNAYGIHAASEVYFGKDQSKLSVTEAATLVGMLQNPSYFNPNRYPERMIRKRWTVLSVMQRNGFLSEQQFDTYKVAPLGLNFKQVSFSDDKAPYLCDVLEKEVKRILENPECRKPDGSVYNIYRDGLKVYTTIDPVFQQHAEEAMQEQMKKLQTRFFAVWKGRDPWTHRGRDTKDEEIDMRREDLWKHIREGDRFQNLWTRYLDPVADKVQKKFSFELRDIDVERMLREDKKPGAMAKMLIGKPAEITIEQAGSYLKIMTGAEWPEIKKQYLALRTMVIKQYETHQKMKVFSWYGPKFERDTIMTPLDSLKYTRMFLQTGILAVDPTTSEIKAWVGGINFKHFQFDHVRTDRQVGSTFKPYVYATAISQQGISPCFPVYDQAVTIPAHYMNFTTVADWTPKNSTNKYTGAKLTLYEALKGSVNSVSAFLMKQMGDTEPVRGLINNMGIDSSARRADGQYRVPKQPSICLGASDLTVFEMTGAYATFANKGMYGKPFVIKKIEDKNGKVLFRSLLEEKVALAPNVDYVLLDMLKYNVKGVPGIKNLKSEVGGKTGTTQDFTDGWFMGVTPRLVVGTWVGGEDRWVRFLSIEDGQGAKMARPLFASFIGRLENDPKSGYDYNARFERPPGDLGIETNCNAYKDGLPPTGGDEEQFSPDIFNDELNDKNKPATSKPDDTFGDQLN